MEFKVGDRVWLTGQFLRNTGQFAGGEGQKVWTVIAVTPVARMRGKGKKSESQPLQMVVVDEPADTSYFTKEEIEAEPNLKFRRILSSNLKHYGKPSMRDAV